MASKGLSPTRIIAVVGTRRYHRLTIPFFVSLRGLLFILGQLLHGNTGVVKAVLRGGADLVIGRGKEEAGEDGSMPSKTAGL